MSLPTEPYLYACSDGEQAYLFTLQSPRQRVSIEPAPYVFWRHGHPGAAEGRYLFIGNGVILDVRTLQRFTLPPLPGTTYKSATFRSPDRSYQFFKDDWYADWQAQVVDQAGAVVEDLGLVVGNQISPDFEWVYEVRDYEDPFDPEGGLWVQRLRGGAPLHLTQCQSEAGTPRYDFRWELDGRHLMHVSNEDSYRVTILRCDVETDEVEIVQRVVVDGPITRSVLSLDLRRLAFTTERGVLDGLYGLDLESGELSQLHDGRDYHFFDWTRDGRYLVVEVDNGSAEGEGPRKLVSFPEGKASPLEGRFPCWPISPCSSALTLDDIGSEAPGGAL